MKPRRSCCFPTPFGGSCDNNPYLGNHWAKRGLVVVFVQHPGSDEAVWKDVALAERAGAMMKAASAANFMMRAADIPAAIDALSQVECRGGPSAARAHEP